MRSALVTGAAGFVGRHLVNHLCGQGIRVSCLDRLPHEASVNWPGEWFAGDVTDAAQMVTVVAAARPDYVFHLAALLKTESLAELLSVNVIGTKAVLDAIARVCPEARVVVAGTSAEYGLARLEESPIREENPLRPLSLYGVSKVAQGLVADQYVHRHNLRIIRTRTFNLTGPGEPETLVCSAFAKQLAEIKAGRRPPKIEVGNLEAGRDFLDVRDAVRAYWELANLGAPGAVYNVCSGESVSIRKVLGALIDLAGVPVEVNQSPLRYTKWDVPDQVGEPGRCRSLTGWTPTLSLERSLQDLLSDWGNRLAAT